MKSNIFIPKKINVGFQNRSDTYTKKLAYVIYYDEKGKLRKEASWNSWRDKDIPNEEFENVPTEGFVLNKKAGGYNTGWNHRQTYTRIYDSRNFEFEITIDNLLYILENATSTKGKGLEGQFVYGWDGKDLVLIPCESPDYKEIQDYNKIVHENLSIKAKDLIIGATYKTKDNKELVYLGKYEKYGYKGNGDKQFWFYDREPSSNYYYDYRFEVMKTIPKNKLIHVVDENCCTDYADLFKEMECSCSYSPIDNSKDEYVDYDLEYFTDYINTEIINKNGWWVDVECYSQQFDEDISKIKIRRKRNNNLNLLEVTKRSIKMEKQNGYWGYKEERKIEYDELLFDSESIEEIFNKLKPQYKNVYLKNGNLKEGVINNE